LTPLSEAMGRAAAGRYLSILLEERDLSVPVAAERLGISPKTLGRWLSGEVAAPIDGFHDLIALAGGSPQQVHALLQSKSARSADGIRVAGEWLSRDQDRQLQELAAMIPTEEDLEGLIAAWKRLQARGGADR